MKFVKSKKSAILIVLLLMISMSTSMAFVPNVRAHSPPLQIPSYAFLNVAPNPAGIGQTVTVDMWLGQVPPTALAQYGDRWMNYKVTVTKPDGTNETLGPFTSDDTGGFATTYTPTAIGNYTFVFNFPGQTLAGKIRHPVLQIPISATTMNRPPANRSNNYSSAVTRTQHPSSANSNKLLVTPHRIGQRQLVHYQWQLAWARSNILRTNRSLQRHRRLQPIHNRANNVPHHLD